jgi:hypothetical protein
MATKYCRPYIQWIKIHGYKIDVFIQWIKIHGYKILSSRWDFERLNSKETNTTLCCFSNQYSNNQVPEGRLHFVAMRLISS